MRKKRADTRTEVRANHGERHQPWEGGRPEEGEEMKVI